MERKGVSIRRAKEQGGWMRRFVIDGTNVLLVHGRKQPELRYVLALCSYLRKQGAFFVCFFDANTSYILRDYGGEQAEVFERFLLRPYWSECFQVVPSGTDADEWILQRAKAEGADVISNDKYRSRARDNRWIWKRRHGLVGTSDSLMIETLDLKLPVLPGAGEYP